MVESSPFFRFELQPIIFESYEPIHGFIVFFLDEAGRLLWGLLSLTGVAAGAQLLEFFLQLFHPLLLFLEASQCAFVEGIRLVAVWLEALGLVSGLLRSSTAD